MRKTTLFIALLITTSAFTQMLGNRRPTGNNRHSSILTRRGRNNDAHQGEQHQQNDRVNRGPTTGQVLDTNATPEETRQNKIIAITNSIRRMGKSLSMMKKRETYLKNRMNNGAIKQKDTTQKKQRMKRYKQVLNKSKNRFKQLLDTYKNLVNEASEKIKEETQELSAEEKKIRQDLRKMKMQARKNHMNFEQMKKRIKKKKKNLKNQVDKANQKGLDESEILEEVAKMISDVQVNKNKQKKDRVMSRLRNINNYATARINKQISKWSSLIQSATGTVKAPQPTQDQTAEQKKFKNLMLCVNTYRQQIELLRSEISEDADLASEYIPDSACEEVNPDVGLGQGGCFYAALDDFTTLAKTAKMILSPEALTDFQGFSKKMENAANSMKADVKAKCVENRKLARTNRACADTIKEVFQALVSDTESDGYMQYIEMNSELEQLMNDDFWLRVNQNCNK